MWQLIGIWPYLAVTAALYVVVAAALIAKAGTTPLSMAIASMAFCGGAAAIGALAFWARDRWLAREYAHKRGVR